MKHYFYLSKKRTNNKGVAPVVCRLVHNGERRDFRTGLWVEPVNWDIKRSWPKSDCDRICSRLTLIKSNLNNVVFDCQREKCDSIDEVLIRYRDQQQPVLTTLQRIAEEYLNVVKPSERVKTRILLAVSRFEEITGINKISRVLPETLKGFESELMSGKKPLSAVWTCRKLQFLKRLFVYAENKKYIGNNVFRFYKYPHVEKPKLIQLSSAELDGLKEHHFASERLRYVRDLFVFQCYTGLSYSDLWLFGPGSVSLLHDIKLVKGRRAKTGEDYLLPLLPEAAAIAARYNYCFRQISNQRYNSYLKEVAEIRGIEKKLTTHVGRKTFAQNMIDKGYSAEAVSKMMGHASFTMTQRHYGRIGEKRIEMEVLRMAS